jgi:hypothetical protein
MKAWVGAVNNGYCKMRGRGVSQIYHNLTGKVMGGGRKDKLKGGSLVDITKNGLCL